MNKRTRLFAILTSVAFIMFFVSLAGGAQQVADENLGIILVEVMWLPVDGSYETSGSVLEQGALYKLKVSGTFNVGGPGDGLADAEYADFSNPPDSLLDLCGDGSVDLAVGINDDVVDNVTHPHWGRYNSDHVYQRFFIGKGSTIRVNYHDCDPTNNFGSLFLEIYKVSWQSVYPALFKNPSALELFKAYRDEILPRSGEGREYKGLIYANSAVILQLLLDNPALLLQAKALIEANKDAVAEVLGGGEGVIDNTDEVVSFLNSWADEAPPAMKTALDRIKRDLNKSQKEGTLFLGFKWGR